jgi:hypothetical protein
MSIPFDANAVTLGSSNDWQRFRTHILDAAKQYGDVERVLTTRSQINYIQEAINHKRYQFIMIKNNMIRNNHHDHYFVFADVHHY